MPNKSVHRYRFSEFYTREKKLADGLIKAGLKSGDRVGTLCWNHYAHLEAYFGVPCAGGVLHTLNLRLHADELAYIAKHAGDRFLIVDEDLLPFSRVSKIRSILNGYSSSATTDLPYRPIWRITKTS